MKIVDRTAFLSLPPGTVFCKVETPPNYGFDELLIKGDSYPNDFAYQGLTDIFAGNEDSEDYFESIDAMHAGGAATPDLDCMSRDGLFDADQLFAIWEADDVTALVNRLLVAASEGYAAEPRRVLIGRDGEAIDITTLEDSGPSLHA